MLNMDNTRNHNFKRRLLCQARARLRTKTKLGLDSHSDVKNRNDIQENNFGVVVLVKEGSKALERLLGWI